MSRYIKIFLSCIVLSFCTDLPAQVAQNPAIAPQNWDGDFQQLQYNLLHNDYFSTFDIYLQYAPYAAFCIMKVAGVPSRSDWGRFAVSAGTGAVIFVGMNNLLKYTVCRERPDHSSKNSFPSGHSGLAFAGAHSIYREFGHISPWISFGGYSVAAITSISRIVNNKHWMSDTIGGALLGIGSVELGYWIGDLIYKKSGKGLNQGFLRQGFEYDFDCDKHYNLSLLYYRRFVVGKDEVKGAGAIPYRGGGLALEAQIPLIPACGLCVRT